MTALLVYVSCSESFLEKVPLNESSDATFYQSEGDAVAAVNAIYDVLQYIRLWKFEITVIGNRFNDDSGLQPRPTQFPSGYQATNARLLSMWENLYIGINRANIAMERIPSIEMDEELKARLLGEAKFLRGLYYFTLATFFEDVPLRLEPTNLENLGIAKSPKADVVAQARKDLTEAIDVLPERAQQDASDLGRATRGAALGMLGKLELYQQNFSEAIPLFQTLVESGEYQLIEDYGLQFQSGGDNTPESVFEVQTVTGGGGWANDSEGSWMSGWNSVSGHTSINYGFGAGNQPSEDFVSAYEAGDLRESFNIVRHGDDYFGVPFDSAKSATGYGHRKYIIPAAEEATSGDSGINFHLMRYADVLLMYAEALNEVSGPTAEAYAAINQVRNRAGLADLAAGMSKEEFFRALVHERRIELYLEAHRTWDLIRWGLAEEVLTPCNGFVVGKHERLPVPQTELDTNPLMVQHPAYQ